MKHEKIKYLVGTVDESEIVEKINEIIEAVNLLQDRKQEKEIYLTPPPSPYSTNAINIIKSRKRKN